MNQTHLTALVSLVFAAAALAQDPADASSSQLEIVRPPILPEAIASFGAARVGPWLYVFGGHIGRQRKHSVDNVVGSFRRVNLETNAWEDLPSGPPLQGTALIAASDGNVYRIGGGTARNAAGAEEDLHSTASVQRFDPQIGAWEDATA